MAAPPSSQFAPRGSGRGSKAVPPGRIGRRPVDVPGHVRQQLQLRRQGECQATRPHIHRSPCIRQRAVSSGRGLGDVQPEQERRGPLTVVNEAHGRAEAPARRRALPRHLVRQPAVPRDRHCLPAAQGAQQHNGCPRFLHAAATLTGGVGPGTPSRASEAPQVPEMNPPAVQELKESRSGQPGSHDPIEPRHCHID